jgi:transposase-like protein
MPAARACRYPMALAQQFICKKCKSLSNVQTYECTREGSFFCVCPHCGAKNRVVRTGMSESQPASYR